MNKIDFRHLKNIFADLARKAAERPFLSFLFIVILAAFLGGLIFYKSYFLHSEKSKDVSSDPVYFQEQLYLDILEEWRERRAEFEGVQEKIYLDLF